MKRAAELPKNRILLCKCPETKKFKTHESVVDNMEKNHSRPLSNMDFLKPKSPSKYSMRPKKIERMSNNQIATIIKRNEDLEEEIKILKAVANLDKDVSAVDKGMQVSLDIVPTAEKALQVSIAKMSFDKETQTAIDDTVVVLDNVAVHSEDDLMFDYLPWLNIVREKKDFYSLEKQLIFCEELQTDLSMMIKFEEPQPEGNEEDEGLIEKYQLKIQVFMTDYKLLVKRKLNNWVH